MSAVTTKKTACCSFIEKLPPNAQSLIYWRSPFKSCISLALGLTIFISLGCLSMLSVFAYSCLTILCCSAAWRIYHDVIGSKKADATASPTCPLGEWMSKDFSIPRERVSDFVNHTFDRTLSTQKYFRRVLLVESYVESLKFSLYMYLLSIVGGFFNLITIATIAFILLFILPKTYELYQPQLDKFGNKCAVFYDKMHAKFRAQLDRIPMLKKNKAE